MSRYRVLPPRAAYVRITEDWSPSVTADVAICDDDPVRTGLLDHRGHPIVRIKDPIGFVRMPDQEES